MFRRSMTEKDIGHKGQMISSASDHMHIDPLKQGDKRAADDS